MKRKNEAEEKRSYYSRRFGELLREAVEEEPDYEKMRQQIKSVDYSFMEKYPDPSAVSSDFDDEEFSEYDADGAYDEFGEFGELGGFDGVEAKEEGPAPEKPGKGRRSFTRLGRVAVICICFCAAVVATAVWLNSEPASAFKSELQKILVEIRGGVYVTDELDKGDKENQTADPVSYSTENEDDVLAAAELVSEFYMSEYIPEGYEFVSFDLDAQSERSYNADYVYQYGNNTFGISIQSDVREKADIYIFNQEDAIKKDDRLIVYWTDEATDTHGVDVLIDDDILILIYGTLSKEEMIKVAENVNAV